VIWVGIEEIKKRKIKANILTSGVVKANLKHYKNLINNLFVTIKYPNLIDNEWKEIQMRLG